MSTWRLEVSVAGLDPLVATGPASGELGAEDLPRVVRASWVDELDPDDQSWPARQAVSTGQLQLLMATAAEAAAITATSPVAVELYRPADAATPVATFYGRAGEPQLAIHDHGVMVSMAITDYLADLAEPTVGDVDYPAETAGQRALRILGEAGHGQPADMPALEPGPAGFWPPVAARSASATDALPLLQRALHVIYQRRMVVTEGLSYYLPQLWTIRPNVDPATGQLAANPWRGAELPTEAETLPVLQLVEVAGVWQLAAPAAGEPATAGVIPGAAIPHSASWVRPKGRNPNTVDIVKAGERVISTVLAGTTTPVVHRIETDLTADADAAQLGAFLLPLGGADPASSWEAEGFTVLVDETPPGWWPGQLRDARTVTGLQPRHNPEGRDWWAGTIAAIEVEIADGELTAKLQLEARAVVPGPDAITWAELDPAMSWAELAPTITWAELAHVRP